MVSCMNAMVKILSALTDNYMYLLIWGNMAIVVDPSEAQPVLNALKKDNLQLQAILVTHHHWDHIGGVDALVDATECPVIGPEDKRIPRLTRLAEEGEKITFGPLTFEVFSVPGHTTSHVVYYEPNQGWLFSGDTLFGAGCGRLFEGTPKQMFESLNKICQLPDETQVFCGHEYTVKNLEFAASIEPSNKEVADRLAQSRRTREQNIPTVPSSLAIEKKTNPFLRANQSSLRAAINMTESSDLEVFTQVREMR
ncbi:MAG: Hydroxyacylglutathione hydrolase, partial [Chlamydiae bacterium]|nr:Hydroxyacylglutathione hydrolase [Chlamydiota bacterium]